MVRKTLITTAVILLGSLGAMNAHARGGFYDSNSQGAGGFQGPISAPSFTTVAQAKAAPDDSIVLIQGYIVEQIKRDNYLFRDSTGNIRVKIDRDKWAGQVVTPETLVEIWGEVDQDRDSTKIDVKSIRIVQK